MIRMEISNSFKISTFSLKPFEPKRQFLLLNQILCVKHFPLIKINTASKLKAILKTSEHLSQIAKYQNTHGGNFQVK